MRTYCIFCMGIFNYPQLFEDMVHCPNDEVIENSEKIDRFCLIDVSITTAINGNI